MKMFRGAAVAAAIAGSMAAYNAQAVNLSTDGIGEVAIAPYYTVRDGWQTLINLTNTTDVPIVVKVRFHESLNSRDVLDFDVALSGFDVFTGAVRENANGVAEFVAIDQPNADGNVTCTIPSVVASTPQRLNPLGFSQGGNNDGGPGGSDTDFVNPSQAAIDRLSEGYIEFVVMGHADGSPEFADATAPAVFSNTNLPRTSSTTGNTATAANLSGAINIARAIEQHDCARLDTAFNDTVNPDTGRRYIVETARQLGEPINALKFNFRLLNPNRGTEAGNAATTWANFYNPASGPDAVISPLNAQDQACTITRGDYRSTINQNGTNVDRAGGTLWTPDATAPAAGSCRNFGVSQRQFPFLEPSLNDAFPVTANFYDDTLNAAVAVTANLETVAGFLLDGAAGAQTRPRGIDAVSATIQRSDIFNEWSSNATLGVTTDWIVTFPTKSFYVDQSRGQQAGIALNRETVSTEPARFGRPEACIRADLDADGNGVRFDRRHVTSPSDEGDTFSRAAGANPIEGPGVACEEVPYPPFQNAFSGNGTVAGSGSCSTVGFVFFDRAENSLTPPGSEVIVSPAPPPTTSTTTICREANVITFNGGTALDPVGPVNVDTSALGQNAGWMRMNLAESAVANLAPMTTAISFPGLPVIGFNLKQRNFGDVTRNFSSSIDHGYDRGGLVP